MNDSSYQLMLPFKKRLYRESQLKSPSHRHQGSCHEASSTDDSPKSSPTGNEDEDLRIDVETIDDESEGE